MPIFIEREAVNYEQPDWSLLQGRDDAFAWEMQRWWQAHYAKEKETWERFPAKTGTLGIARSEMPQIKSEHRGALANFLRARGIEWEKRGCLPGLFKPTQAEFSPEKVDKAREHDGNRAILVSSDGYVVDGHHQWYACLQDHPEDQIEVVWLDAPIKKVLKEVLKFPSVEQADYVKAEDSRIDYAVISTMPEKVPGGEYPHNVGDTHGDFSYKGVINGGAAHSWHIGSENKHFRFTDGFSPAGQHANRFIAKGMNPFEEDHVDWLDMNNPGEFPVKLPHGKNPNQFPELHQELQHYPQLHQKLRAALGPNYANFLAHPEDEDGNVKAKDVPATHWDLVNDIWLEHQNALQKIKQFPVKDKDAFTSYLQPRNAGPRYAQPGFEMTVPAPKEKFPYPPLAGDTVHFTHEGAPIFKGRILPGKHGQHAGTPLEHDQDDTHYKFRVSDIRPAEKEDAMPVAELASEYEHMGKDRIDYAAQYTFPKRMEGEYPHKPGDKFGGFRFEGSGVKTHFWKYDPSGDSVGFSHGWSPSNQVGKRFVIAHGGPDDNEAVWGDTVEPDAVVLPSGVNPNQFPDLHADLQHYPYLAEKLKPILGENPHEALASMDESGDFKAKDVPADKWQSVNDIHEAHQKAVAATKAFPVKDPGPMLRVAFPPTTTKATETTIKAPKEKFPVPPLPGEKVHFTHEGKPFLIGTMLPGKHGQHSGTPLAHDQDETHYHFRIGGFMHPEEAPKEYEQDAEAVEYGIGDVAKRAFGAVKSAFGGKSETPANEEKTKPAPEPPVGDISLPSHQDFPGLVKNAKWFEHQGINKTYTFDHNGKKFIAKQTGDPAEVANEVAASKIRRLLGMDAPAVEERTDHAGKKFMVMPMLPGRSWNQIMHDPDPEKMAKMGFAKRLEAKMFGGAEGNQGDYERLAKSLPKEELGRLGFGNWFLNATDRHANNYLLREGGVHPIDFGYSFGPWNEQSKRQWLNPTHDAILRNAGYNRPEQLKDIPVPKEHLQAALDNKEKIEQALRDHILPRHQDPNYPAQDLWDSYQSKFAQIAEALKQDSPTLASFRSAAPGLVPHTPGRTLDYPVGDPRLHNATTRREQ